MTEASDGHTTEASDGSAQGARRKGWLWVVIAVVAVAVAVGIYFAVTSGADGEATPSPEASPSASSSETADDADPGADPSADPSPDASAPAETMPELAPVAPDAASDNGKGLVAEITAMKAVEGEAVQAGEIGGPAVQFTLRLRNDTDAELDLGLISVNAYIGDDRTPAGGLVQPGGAPFEGTLAVGDSTDAVYLYSIPENQRDNVTLTIDYRAGQPAFVFRGDVG